MCEMARYTQINDVGTAVLLEALVRRRTGRLVVASSMSIYGEGLYRDVEGTIREYATRPLDCGVRGEWDPVDEEGRPLLPLPTPENKPPQLASVYALGKFVQERMSLMVGRAYGIPTVALRFFNVYGPRQALSNPYTGVLAIFASRLLNDRPPVIFEDGAQRRDFVHVSDVVRACLGAMERPEATGQVINVGSGRSISVIEAARALAKVMGRNGVEPTVRGEYRVGDVRHCFADISRARLLLGYEPRVTFEAGLAELAEWLGGQAAEDHVEAAHAELAARGLTR
jgi:dTDP-L-rhamnose 4-epimerase